MRTGQETDIGAPPLTPRRWGLLLDAAPEMTLRARRKIIADGADETEVPAMPVSDIGRGVTFTPLGCEPLSRAEVEMCDAEELDGLVSGGDLPIFEAFDVYLTEKCSSLDVDLAWLNDRLETRWQANVSAAVTAELTSGDTVSDDTPTLVNSATALGGGFEPLEALSAIEGWLAAKLNGAAGMVFVTPTVLTFLGDHLELVDGIWYTRTGHIVISDAGFTGPAPTGQSSGPTEFWIYGSGMVTVKVGPPRHRDQAAVEYLDRTRNIQTAMSMGLAVFAFDPCTVGAAGAVPLTLGS